MKKITLITTWLIVNMTAYSWQGQQVQTQKQACTQQTPCTSLDLLERNSNLRRRQQESKYDFQTRVLADILGEDERYQYESSEEFRERVLNGGEQQHQ